MTHSIGRSDWADWCRSGDLLFARNSRLYRLRYADGMLAPLEEAIELIDLAPLLPYTRDKAPPELRCWPSP